MLARQQSARAPHRPTGCRSPQPPQDGDESGNTLEMYKPTHLFQVNVNLQFRVVICGTQAHRPRAPEAPQNGDEGGAQGGGLCCCSTHQGPPLHEDAPAGAGAHPGGWLSLSIFTLKLEYISRLEEQRALGQKGCQGGVCAKVQCV